MKVEKYGSEWTRDELILALYLYCQIPFAKTKANNPEVIRLAQVLGRTPSSVARKLGNFGAFDPLLASKGISGLTHFSRADQATWTKFYGHWDTLVEESQKVLGQLEAPELPQIEDDAPVIARPSGESQKQATVTVRLHQAFFRRTVLASYETTCCICGLDFRELLVASHIVPWAANEEKRTDPQNGLCLCSLHDKAFDRGLISVKPSLEIVISLRVLSSKVDFARLALADFQNQAIHLPRRFPPKSEHLEWHYTHIFQA